MVENSTKSLLFLLPAIRDRLRNPQLGPRGRGSAAGWCAASPPSQSTARVTASCACAKILVIPGGSTRNKELARGATQNRSKSHTLCCERAPHRPKRLGVSGAASCSTSPSAGCCAPGMAPATRVVPSSVAASALCKARLKGTPPTPARPHFAGRQGRVGNGV